MTAAKNLNAAHLEVDLRKSALLCLMLAAGITSAEDGARYLVICADTLYKSIQPLAQWKQATGLSTRVVALSEVGSDTTAIRDYVRFAWNNWPIKPEYLLLVGNGTLLPARLYRQGGSVFLSSDNIYADVDADTWAELAVGRLPAASAAQLDVMVAKTLMYERSPVIDDSTWMRRMTTVVREDGDQDDTLYWNNVRHAAIRAASAGFVGCDSFSHLRGHAAADVTNSCNQGTGLVLYRGRANGDWYPPFDRIRPGSFTSTGELCVLASITCRTLTLVPEEEAVCDSWFRAGSVAAPRGAVAVFGNTHNNTGVAGIRGAVCRGFYDALFEEGIYEIGKTALRAKWQLHVEYPTYDGYCDYRGFNLYGDPSLGIWTAAPRQLTVVHPSSLKPESQDLAVTVSWKSSPVESALVCASMDSTVYAFGFSDSLGRIDLSISPQHEGSLRLVVTGRNLHPCDTHIPVARTSVEEPNSAGQPGRATFDLTCSPNPFRGAATLHFSASSLGLHRSFLRVYDSQGRAVFSPSGIRTSPFGLDLRSEPAGIYIAVLRDISGRNLGRARLLKTD